jgi:RHS repeat-associated protein
MKWTLINPAGTNDPDTGDIYSGLDRFGRVKDNRWLDGAGDDLDRIQYGYDRAGNRVWRRNVVAAALGKEFDELYGYDGIHRLKHMARGTLNGGRTALTSETFAQCWTLDSTGNWQGFREDDTGNGTWDLIQQRAANAVNEISGITETAGPSWVTPAYSRAGNMTTLPQPADPTQSYTATYDAWNRLVKIADGADTISEYAYDGAKRRIVQKSYSGGVLDETRHLYYTQPASWQVLEERVGASPDSADAERQFIWGLRYIDDLVLRDRDTDGNSSLDERLYACQDANWNVTAIADDAGDVQERYAYKAYGTPAALDSTFVPQVDAFDWETLYCGYRGDFNTDIIHVRHRCYSFVTGAWLTRDTIVHSSELSLYAYVLSSPLKYTDPSGADIYVFIDIGNDEGEEIINTYSILEARAAKTCADWAQESVKDMPGKWGGQGDAIRHCIWMCCTASISGQSIALGIGDIHEKHNPTTLPPNQTNPPNGFISLDDWTRFDDNMDRANNKIGADLARNIRCRLNPFDSCTDACTQAFKDGKLNSFGYTGYVWAGTP